MPHIHKALPCAYLQRQVQKELQFISMNEFPLHLRKEVHGQSSGSSSFTDHALAFSELCEHSRLCRAIPPPTTFPPCGSWSTWPWVQLARASRWHSDPQCSSLPTPSQVESGVKSLFLPLAWAFFSVMFYFVCYAFKALTVTYNMIYIRIHWSTGISKFLDNCNVVLINLISAAKGSLSL